MNYAQLKSQAESKLSEAQAVFAEAESVKKLEVKKDKTMRSWLDYTFESSSGLTDEFALFSRQMKSYLKKTLASFGLNLITYSRMHFEFSVFAKNIETGKMVYLACSDVRYFKNSWYENLLIRTAQHDRDFTGGRNDSTGLVNVGAKALEMTI